jgi:hypothetical protein
MTYPRLYNRVRPTGMMGKSGQIVVAPRAPVIKCTIVDYSAGGACLEIFPIVALPERFELLYGNVKKRSRIVWRRGIRIGVAF